MLLRTKIVLVLVPVVIGYALLDHVVQRSILRPSFDRLETEQAERDLERTKLAIRGEVDRLSDRAEAWCRREGLAEFARGENPEYAEEHLGDPLFQVDGFGLAYVLDTEGNVVWGEARTTGSTEHVRLSEFPRGRFAAGHPLLSAMDAPEAVLGLEQGKGETTLDPDGPVSGVTMTEVGPLLVASHTISGTSNGTSFGRLILGRFLDATTIRQIADQSRVEFDVWNLANAPEALGQELLDEISGSATPILRALSENELATYATVNDLREHPALVLGARSHRSISRSGAAVVRYALLSTMAAGVLMLLVLLRVLQILVLAPISRFTEQAVHVGKTDDTTARLELDRADEIGILSKEFDSMLAKLAASRSALVDSARSAGMSEIATGILHNIGNVLNSVGVAGSLVERKLRKSPIDKLEAVIGLLRQHTDNLPEFVANDPRGQQLLPVLESLHRLLDEDRVESLEEVDTLNGGLEHIRGLVASQQAFARRSDVREVLKLKDVVEEALSICERSGATTRHIRIETDFEDIPAFRIDRNKSLEILVNLLRNAFQAIQMRDPQDPCVRISIRAVNEESARVSVEDNGVGIEPDHIERIFNHGFTTKSDGHGFGLHSAANSAGEMDCKLTVESAGPGQGATFHLDMPLDSRSEQEQAA